MMTEAVIFAIWYSLGALSVWRYIIWRGNVPFCLLCISLGPICGIIAMLA